MPKARNIIVFASIAVALVLGYIFFLQPGEEEASLVSTENTGGAAAVATAPDAGISIGQDFLAILLNVKNIKLNDSIFSDGAFSTLRDSSIELVQDGTEGRSNPFAPLGNESGLLAPAPVVQAPAPAPLPAPTPKPSPTPKPASTPKPSTPAPAPAPAPAAPSPTPTTPTPSPTPGNPGVPPVPS